jgi:hypothetical protein
LYGNILSATRQNVNKSTASWGRETMGRRRCLSRAAARSLAFKRS